MAEGLLARLIEHNNWANRAITRSCAGLTDAQFDARPVSAKQWSIRENLVHLVVCQRDYLAMLQGQPEPSEPEAPPSFAELEASADASGAGLLELDVDAIPGPLERDGYRIGPWVVLLQALNHATEHRKQIAHLMRAQGLEPPRMDGWAFGEAERAVTPPPGA